jgi:uncharacterized protein YndB with AHSA1/START domain
MPQNTTGSFLSQFFGGALLLLGVLTIDGCGEPLSTLNRLAAVGSIHEDAPVTTHLQIQIAAPPARVWAILIDAPSWPKWQKPIENVAAAGPLEKGMSFSWRTGGTNIHSQVQLFEPERRLSWTGTAMTAKAVHVWELKPQSGNQTLLIMKESMDGPLMATLYSSQELGDAGNEWLRALKHAAELRPWATTRSRCRPSSRIVPQ